MNDPIDELVTKSPGQTRYEIITEMYRLGLISKHLAQKYLGILEDIQTDG